MNNTIIAIPARLESTRLKRKCLLKIDKQEMVIWVLKQAQKVKNVDMVMVTTDSLELADLVLDNGGWSCFDNEKYDSGTDRISKLFVGVDNETLIVNVQCDMPFIDHRIIEELIEFAKSNSNFDMWSVVKRVPVRYDSKGKVKVKVNSNGEALFFSRELIDKDDYFFWHIGVYAYKNDFLQKFTKLPQSPLEKKYNLEQMRVMENGFKIGVVRTFFDPGIDVNTPEDIAEIIKAGREVKE